MTIIAWTDVVDATDNDPLIVAFAAGGRTMILNAVNTQLDQSMFDGEDPSTPPVGAGVITKLARCYLAAHMAVLAKLGQAGPLTAQSDGRLSQQYAMPMGTNGLLSTSYGRNYYSLIQPQAFGPMVL